MSNSTSPRPPPIDFNALLSEFDASGLSAAGFARSKGLASWRIYHALQKRSGKLRTRRLATRAHSNVLLPVHVVAAKPAPNVAAMEILLASGHRVLVGNDFDAPTLRRLLAALTQC